MMSVGGGVYGALCRRRGLRARARAPKTHNVVGWARARGRSPGRVNGDGWRFGCAGRGVEWTPVFARPPPSPPLPASGGRKQPEQSVPSGGGGRTITI